MSLSYQISPDHTPKSRCSLFMVSTASRRVSSLIECKIIGCRLNLPSGEASSYAHLRNRCLNKLLNSPKRTFIPLPTILQDQDYSTVNHGHPSTQTLGYPSRAVDQYHQLARELFPEILPVSCAILAAIILRRCRYLQTKEDTIRPAEDCRIRACKDGGRALRWHPSWSYYQPECNEDSSEVRSGREAHEAESYV